MTKNEEKKLTTENFFGYFLQIAIYSFSASKKDVQATGEAISPQKRISSTSKHEISKLFPIFGCHLGPPAQHPIWIRNTAISAEML
jgi:hypothetical protein